MAYSELLLEVGKLEEGKGEGVGRKQVGGRGSGAKSEKEGNIQGQ